MNKPIKSFFIYFYLNLLVFCSFFTLPNNISQGFLLLLSCHTTTPYHDTILFPWGKSFTNDKAIYSHAPCSTFGILALFFACTHLWDLRTIEEMRGVSRGRPHFPFLFFHMECDTLHCCPGTTYRSDISVLVCCNSCYRMEGNAMAKFMDGRTLVFW